MEKQTAIQQALASDDPLVIGMGVWSLKAFRGRSQLQPYRSQLLQLMGSGRLHQSEHPALARWLYIVCQKTVPREELEEPLDSLAAAIGEERHTIEDVLEPYLIQQGYMMRTPRGRVVTRHAYLHFGLNIPKRAGEQVAGDLFAAGDE